tara:strand:+ start:121 stop:510 length:390 start_codon:yes stop_codon:yes gene_type:complete
MAHFAKLDTDNLVEDIVFVENSITHMDVSDSSTEDEQRGIDYLKDIFGSDTVWKQCSYNTWSNQHKDSGTPFRFNMPEIGYSYDSLRDGFIPPKPGNDYILIERKLQWTSMADWTSQYKEEVKTFRSDV